MTIRELLHHQLDQLPDDIIQQIADFTFFVMSRRNIAPAYVEWGDNEWQKFALGQFFREDDEVEYTLKEAKEVYHP